MMSWLPGKVGILRQDPIRRSAGPVAALLLLAGCSSFTPVEAPAFSEQPLPPPEWRAYRIQVDDFLSIRFWGDSELDQDVTVRPDGMISLPYVDDVRAAGLTPAELDAELTRRYAVELRSPQLTVIVSGAGGRQIYIGGEVGGRGSLQLTQNMTLLQAIQVMGGFSTSSRLGQVLLIRTMPGGERVARSVDLRPVLTGADPSQDIPLQGNDIIYVPRTKIANLNLWFEQYVSSILPIDAILSAAVWREVFEDDEVVASGDVLDDLIGDDDDDGGDGDGDGGGDDDGSPPTPPGPPGDPESGDRPLRSVPVGGDGR